MSTTAMRWLDRWLGVPLCFLLSLLPATRSAAPVHARTRRVLCVQLAEMGSLVLAAPAVTWLRAQGREPYFVSFARNGACIAAAGLVAADHVFLWRTATPLVFAADMFRFLVWAWRCRFDAVVDFEPCSRFSALLGVLAGARLRVGYAQGRADRGRLYNLPVAYRGDRHFAENCIALVARLIAGVPPPLDVAERDWRGKLPPAAGDAGARIEDILGRRFPFRSATTRLVLMNANAGDLLPQRRWPWPRYVELAQRLLAGHADIVIGFIGATGEAAAVDEIVAAVGSPRCASLAGDVSLADLPTLFARCRLLISNDSGPAHIAALVRTPALVMFGPEAPARYRPLGVARVLYAGLACSPCISVANQRRCSCRDNRCMQAIEVDDVAAGAAVILADPGESRRVASADS